MRSSNLITPVSKFLRSLSKLWVMTFSINQLLRDYFGLLGSYRDVFGLWQPLWGQNKESPSYWTYPRSEAKIFFDFHLKCIWKDSLNGHLSLLTNNKLCERKVTISKIYISLIFNTLFFWNSARTLILLLCSECNLIFS